MYARPSVEPPVRRLHVLHHLVERPFLCQENNLTGISSDTGLPYRLDLVFLLEHKGGQAIHSIPRLYKGLHSPHSPVSRCHDSARGTEVDATS